MASTQQFAPSESELTLEVNGQPQRLKVHFKRGTDKPKHSLPNAHPNLVSE